MRYFTEVLDLNYQVGMSNNSNEKFKFSVMKDMETKRVAVQYVKDYLLVHLRGKLKPYSWLLVDKIQRDFIGAVSSPYAATGQRAIALACNVLPRLSDEQKEQYTAQVMTTIIAKLARKLIYDEFKEKLFNVKDKEELLSLIQEATEGAIL